MARIEPLRPGEEPFNTGDKTLSAHKANREHRQYGKPLLGGPRVGATEEEEDAWAMRQHLGEMRRQRKEEEAVYKAARSGVKVEHEDPVLQQVQEYGEEMHSADRRHDFLIGMGAFGRAMSTLSHFGRSGSNLLSQAARYPRH